MTLFDLVDSLEGKIEGVQNNMAALIKNLM